MPPRQPPPGTAPREEPQEEQIPRVEDRSRSAKYKKMQNAVEGFYIMLGGAITVMPPQMAGQQVKRVGLSLAKHSEEIAEAWIDLAEENPRVRAIIESVTGFSGWGKVMGEHLKAIGDETPAIQGMRQQRQPQEAPQQSDDIAAAMALADFLSQAAAGQRQQTGNGEPQQPSPEQVRRMMQEQERQQQRPQRQQQQQPVSEPVHPMGQGNPQPVPPGQAPPMGQTRKPVGMPTPADLGVVNPDMPEDFPAGGSQDVRG